MMSPHRGQDRGMGTMAHKRKSAEHTREASLQLHRRLLASLAGVLVFAVVPQPCHSTVEYILARREEMVDSICLGKSLAYALAWDPDADVADLPGSDYAQILWKGGGAISNGSFMYIGDYTNLTDHFCASKMNILLHNASRTNHFIDTQGSPLPGSAGMLAYVTPIWRAAAGVKVSFTVVNMANETWQVASNLPEDTIVEPNSTTTTEVPGSFFNSSLDTYEMVTEYLALVATDRVNYPLATTQGTIILDENDGSTAYIFFGVFLGSSKMCTEVGQKPNASLANSTCVLAHVFEAQYDVSDVDFSEYNYFFSGAARRRRLLQTSEVPRAFSRHDFRKQGKGRTLLATPASTGSRTPPGAVRSVFCVNTGRTTVTCRRGLAAYPRCAISCKMPNRSAGK